MDKLKIQIKNSVDEKIKKLIEMFLNPVTETINENVEVINSINKILFSYS